jgi:hypothetical protein
MKTTTFFNIKKGKKERKKERQTNENLKSIMKTKGRERKK